MAYIRAYCHKLYKRVVCPAAKRFPLTLAPLKHLRDFFSTERTEVSLSTLNAVKRNPASHNSKAD